MRYFGVCDTEPTEGERLVVALHAFYSGKKPAKQIKCVRVVALFSIHSALGNNYNRTPGNGENVSSPTALSRVLHARTVASKNRCFTTLRTV